MNTKRPVEDTIGVTGCTRGPPSPVTVARYGGGREEPLGAERGELGDGESEVGPRSHGVMLPRVRRIPGARYSSSSG